MGIHKLVKGGDRRGINQMSLEYLFVNTVSKKTILVSRFVYVHVCGVSSLSKFT